MVHVAIWKLVPGILSWTHGYYAILGVGGWWLQSLQFLSNVHCVCKTVKEGETSQGMGERGRDDGKGSWVIFLLPLLRNEMLHLECLQKTSRKSP